MREMDVFGDILRHMVEGTMFHLQMAQLFCYLGLSGFSTLQERRFLDENRTMMDLERFVIETLGTIPDTGAVEARNYLPAEWHDDPREILQPDQIGEYVKFGVETWKDWEEKTKTLYNRCYYSLDDLRSAYASDEVMKILRGTGDELRYVYALSSKLRGCQYDMPTIALMDGGIVKEYERFMKEVKNRYADKSK